MKWIQKGYPVKTVCRICEVPRSTYYYHIKHPVRRQPKSTGRPIPGFSFNRKGRKVSDTQIKRFLMQLIQGENSAFGYRKLTVLLRRKHKLIINKKKVYRLCKELQILHPQREIKKHPPKQIAKNRVVTGPNQLWQMDIKYGYIAGKRRHFYLASIIDVFDRSIVAYHRGKSCHKTDVTHTLQKAIMKRGVNPLTQKLIIRTDNGPQFKSKEFNVYCERMNVEHERIPNKTPNMNAYIESFHSILEKECYLRHCFESFEQAFAEVDRFIRYYNNRRIHGSLQDWPPKNYLKMVMEGSITPKKIAV